MRRSCWDEVGFSQALGKRAREVEERRNIRSAPRNSAPKTMGAWSKHAEDMLGRGQPIRKSETGILSGKPCELHDKPKARLAAHEALAIAAITMKGHFDRRHTANFMEIDDQVYLRLSQGYTMPLTISPNYGP